jgi:hypothetical protein
MRRSLVPLVAATALSGGCKSDWEKERDAWQGEFGALSERYQALPREGAPELPPEQAKGRRALIAPRVYNSSGPPLDEARTAAEVGIVVVWSVKDDPTPSRTYEGGIVGYGGTVEVAAFAHPEGKRLARSTWHCLPPTQIMRMTNLRSGATDSYAEHCSPSDTSLREIAAALTHGRAPEGSNASDDTAKAFDAIAARYRPLFDGRTAPDPPDARDRKLLLYYQDDGAAPKLFHNEYLLPAAAYADRAAQVGVFGVVRTAHEARPSEHYSNGAVGYRGSAEVVLFAHPEAKLLSRTKVPCTLSSDDLVVNVLKRTEPERCAGDGAAVRAAIEAQLGPLGPSTK